MARSKGGGGAGGRRRGARAAEGNQNIKDDLGVTKIRIKALFPHSTLSIPGTVVVLLEVISRSPPLRHTKKNKSIGYS